MVYTLQVGHGQAYFQKVLRFVRSTGIIFTIKYYCHHDYEWHWFKLGFDIHHRSISYPGCLQDHSDAVSHLQLGYFDLVNSVDQVKHGSQGNDSKNNMVYICSKHAQNQYCSFSFESLAPDPLISDYYHFILAKWSNFITHGNVFGSPRVVQCSRGYE